MEGKRDQHGVEIVSFKWWMLVKYWTNQMCDVTGWHFSLCDVKYVCNSPFKDVRWSFRMPLTSWHPYIPYIPLYTLYTFKVYMIYTLIYSFKGVGWSFRMPLTSRPEIAMTGWQLQLHHHLLHPNTYDDVTVGSFVNIYEHPWTHPVQDGNVCLTL